MNHLSIKSTTLTKAEILLDGKPIYPSALRLRMAVGEIHTVFLKLAVTVDAEGEFQVCQVPKVPGCQMCKGHGVLEYVFHGSGGSQINKCPVCAGSGQEPQGERKLVD